MAIVRDWANMKAMSERLLLERTGRPLAVWSRRVRSVRLVDESSLRRWLSARGVKGYAQSLIVMERFGYPAYMTTPGAELIARLFARQPDLRKVYDHLIARVGRFGRVAIQARKTYVSSVGPKRTFARVQPASGGKLCVALRLDGVAPGGRLTKSRIHESMPVQLEFGSEKEVDATAIRWVRRAFQLSS